MIGVFGAWKFSAYRVTFYHMHMSVRNSLNGLGNKREG